jgi:hypothetical protein
VSLFPPDKLVLGIDLSLAHTGLCLPDGLVGSIITTPGLPGGIEARCLDIRDRILAQASKGIDLAVIEAPAFAARGNTTDLGIVHGAVRPALYEAGIPFALMAPSALKKYATGSGRATKPDMRAALLRRTGIDIRDDNECDAWWLRAAGLDALGCPIIAMPAENRASVAKLLPSRT